MKISIILFRHVLNCFLSQKNKKKFNEIIKQKTIHLYSKIPPPFLIGLTFFSLFFLIQVSICKTFFLMSPQTIWKLWKKCPISPFRDFVKLTESLVILHEFSQKL